MKVACIGNSITFGMYLDDPSTESYPAQLQQLLGGQYSVTNYGSPGRTLLNGFLVSYINSAQFNSSIAQYNDIVIIVLGTNDTQPPYQPSVDNFINDYKALINQYNNFPAQDPSIFIIGLPPPILENYDGHSNEFLVNQIIPRIKTVANQTKNLIANFYKALEGKPEYFIDGIHTTVEGATIMAKTAKNAIAKALNPAPGTPANFSATSGNKFVKLNWDANSEIDFHHYNLYKGTVPGGMMNYHANIEGNITSYTDNAVDNDITYYYQISAVNSSNNESTRTPQISATPSAPVDVTPPATPTNFTALAENGSIKLSWDSNSESDLASYNLYRGVDDGGWKDHLANVDKSATNYNDKNIDANTTYFYQIDAADLSGNTSDRSNQISTTTLNTTDTYLLNKFSLGQNTPNPFNPITKIEYSIPVDSYAQIIIYDIVGNEVKTLVNEYKIYGQYSILWDGTDNSEESVGGGIYFYKLQTGDFIQTRKMVLLK